MIRFIYLKYRHSLRDRKWTIAIDYREVEPPELTFTHEKRVTGRGDGILPKIKTEVTKTERVLDQKEFDEFRIYCEELCLPAIPEADGGFDGETFELTFDTGQFSSEFRWWCDVPENWQELQHVKDTLMKWAEITPEIHGKPL